MTTQDFTSDATARKDSAFESTAREISEFVVSVAILPVMLLFAKPTTIVRGAVTGNYRPLPSPFLLALVTGIALSGVALHAQGLAANTNSAIGDILRWYGNMNNGVLAILAAIPYLCLLWIVAGGLSLAMMRGERTAEPLWATMSLGIAALVMVSGAAIAVAYWAGATPGQSYVLVICAVVLAYTLILAIKVIRLLFAVRKEHGSPLIGVIISAIAALFIIGLMGIGGSAATVAVYYNTAYRQETAFLEAQQDYHGAIAEYDAQIAQDPANPSLYNSRCWARATLRRELDLALADCDRSLELMTEADPNRPNVLDSRGLVHLGLADFQAAFADYDLAIQIYEGGTEETQRWQTPASYYYGRGIARLGLRQDDAAQADLDYAQSLDVEIAGSYASYGFSPETMVQKEIEPAPSAPAPE